MIEPNEDWDDPVDHRYELEARDQRLIEAVIQMLLRMAGASGVGHAELLSLGFAVYALRRMPERTPGLDLRIDVVTPLSGTEEFKLKRTWSVAFETDPAVRISTGGWAEIEGLGDSFTRFDWYAMTGCAVQFSDYTETLMHLDEFGYWPEGILPFSSWLDELDSIQPSDGYSLEVELQGYPAELEEVENDAPGDRDDFVVSLEDDDY